MSNDMNRDPSNQSLSDLSWNKATSSSMQEDVAHIARSADQHGGGTAGAAAEGVSSLGSHAKERASHYVEGQKQAVTQHLEDFATAIKRASDELSERDQTMASQFVRQAANGLESMSRSINGASVNDMVTSVRAFGRANPVAFIGGAVLAGLAIGRFARASSHREDASGGLDQRTRDWNQNRGSRGESWRASSGYGHASDPAGQPGASPPAASSSGHTTFGPAGSAFSGLGAGAAPPTSQGYAGGGMGADPIQSSTPSSATDPSVSTAAQSGGTINSGAISTGDPS